MNRRRAALQPEMLLVLTFAGLVAGGTLALKAPICHAKEAVGWVDCLFTATSAVCVTGLSTVDTDKAWTRTGHVVILLLIQVGGLGIMTFAAAVFQILQRRLSVGSHAALQETFFQPGARANLRSAFRRIVLTTLALEACGAILIFFGMPRDVGPGAAFHATFLSISAFCNAGFSTLPDNLLRVRDSMLIVWPIMILITLGGLGYSVMHELLDRLGTWLRRERHKPLMWSLNARVVLYTSGLLTFGGAGILLLTGMTGEETTWGERVLHALFQSVTARTAGYNTVRIENLPIASLLILVALMFIGGSPGSCAGGIKTTSAAVGAASAWSGIFGSDTVSILGRRIPGDVLQRTGLVIALAALWQIFGVFVLTFTEGVGTREGAPRFEQVLFEQVSAFNTVGLTAATTNNLSDTGKLWIALSMFAGRVGPLTMGLAVLKQRQRRYEYPVERVMIG